MSNDCNSMRATQNTELKLKELNTVNELVLCSQYTKTSFLKKSKSRKETRLKVAYPHYS